MIIPGFKAELLEELSPWAHTSGSILVDKTLICSQLETPGNSPAICFQLQHIFTTISLSGRTIESSFLVESAVNASVTGGETSWTSRPM